MSGPDSVPFPASAAVGPAALARGAVRFLGAVWTGSGPGAASATGLVALGAAVEAFGLLMLAPVLHLALATDEGRKTGWVQDLEAWFGPERTPGIVLAGFAVLMVARSLILWRRDVILAQRQIRFLEGRRLAVARGLAAASWPTVSRLGHGRVAHVMGGDMARITAGAHFAVQGAVAAVTLAALAAAALSMEPGPAALALTLMALAAWAMARLTRHARDAGARMADSNRSLTTGVGAFLRGMKAAKSQDLQQPFVDGFERDLAAAGCAQVAFLSEQSQVRALWPLVAVATLGIVVTAATATGQREGPALLVLLLVLWRMVGPAAQLQSGMQQVAFALPAWEAIRDLETELAAGLEPILPEADEPPPPGPVELRGVVVRHGGGGGLAGVNLRLEPGGWLGLAGPAGAGKTTLADVLAGLCEPDGGQVLIGGRPMDGTLRAAWRRSLAYVPAGPLPAG
jgi:ATP-binding cassette subfamily C protein